MNSLAAVLFLATTATITNPWASQRYVVFGIDNHWLVIEVHSRKAEPVDLPEGWMANSLVMAPDGKTVFFAGNSQKAPGTFIYQWVRGLGKPVPIGEEVGYSADLTLDSRGEWLYFSHSPNGRGRPMGHSDQDYAQIYRMQVNGAGKEALTTGRGCHFGPKVGPDGKLIYVHSACSLPPSEAVEMVPKRSHKPETVQLQGGVIREFDFAPDGSGLLFASQRMVENAIMFAPSDGTPARLICSLPRTNPSVRPQFGANPSEIYYLADAHVWLFDGKTKIEIAPVTRGNP